MIFSVLAMSRQIEEADDADLQSSLLHRFQLNWPLALEYNHQFWIIRNILGLQKFGLNMVFFPYYFIDADTTDEDTVKESCNGGFCTLKNACELESTKDFFHEHLKLA